ncbi:MAG TPA: M1 family metallopeptidase [Candidatus Elarobacter sp.]|jgi:aminopeptidase N|nr:M1 family metallopeptidase [Candidatus Elarobacter sp.]
MPSALLRAALALVLVVSAVSIGTAKPPFDFETAPGRLSKDVVPLDYRVAIVPDVAARTLTGSETVALRMRKPVTTIAFNSLHEQLSDVKLDGAPVASVSSDDAKQMTTLTLASPAAVGNHTLTFAYTGRLETAPQGLFVQPYRSGATSGTMLSTQFEATDARRMFPCWDEPAFRATFQLSATVPAAWSATSNMPVESRSVNGANATIAFQRTPSMPSYLLEFSAGDLAHVDARAAGRGFGVWAVRGQERLGAQALANAQVILADYDAYFGYPYPLPKLDSIAVPGGFGGAMENWGAITYNDQALLLGPGATLDQRQRVFSIQAHEMAHQWNGDLVTMSWWDDIWLNESFASWMAAKETALRNPSWNWWERQDGSKETAMNADARLNSHPIEQHVTNEIEAGASFDSAITYNKGQAFLRMLEAYLGEDAFRAGVRRYVKARAYSNATSGDLWAALSAASGRDVEKLASGWTTQPGFPVVSVRASCDARGARTIALAQKRFLFAGSDPNRERWSIPMDVRSGASGAPRRVLFTTDGQKFAAGRCGEPLSANAGTVGFYRVAYDAPTLAANRRAFAALPNGDKIALLDDQWALAEANQAPLSAYLSLASALRTDLDLRAWEQALSALSTIERDERGTPGHEAFTAFARSVARPAFAVLGWDSRPGEAPERQALRRAIVAHLGAWDDPAVVAEARRRFAAFVANRGLLDAEQQGVVLPIVAQHADQAAFDRLHAIAKGSANETEVRRYYGALADVRDPKLMQQALAIVMSPEIPPQAAGIRARLVSAMEPNAPQTVWQFYKLHADELNASRSEFEAALAIANVPNAFWDAAPLTELQAFVTAHERPAPPAPFVARAIESARFSLALRDRLVPAADAYVRAEHR